MIQRAIDLFKITAWWVDRHPLLACAAISAVGLVFAVVSIAMLCARDPSAARELPGPIPKAPSRW